MKTFTSELDYINEVALPAQKACKRYGYKPSTLIAQAALENGFGIVDYFDNPEITKLLEANNVVGVKCFLLNDSWDEYTVWDKVSYITKNTPEQYGGKMVTITDKFRAYDCIERCFCDFLLFLKYASNYGKGGTPKYGDAVLSIKDPETLIRKVASLGYATGSTYPTSVMRIVKKHNLTKYDDLTNVEPTNIVPDILKSGKQTDRIHIIDITSQNTPPRWGNTREALVFHFLGVAAAENPYLYDGGYGGQWYISRKGEIYHAVKEGGTVWAVGSGGWGLKTTEWNNGNTESVEMGCENDNGSNDIYDKKWWFHMATQEAAVKLARYWLEKRGYGVSEASVNKRILIHNSITNKPCPAPWLHCAGYRSPRESGHVNWTFEEFKKKIWQGYSGRTSTDNNSTPTPAPSKGYLSKGDTGEDVKTLQTMLNACGFNCGNVDGIFGNKTESALSAFRQANKMTATPKYTDKVKAVLESAYKKATGAKYSTVYDGVDYAPVYNYTYYKKKYPTVAKALGTDKQKYFDNFIEYGMKAGRQGSAAFNVQNYKKRYEDLRNAFGDNLPEYYKHYCVYGKKEKRNAK